MMQSGAGTAAKFDGVGSAFSYIYKHEGAAGFYRGMQFYVFFSSVFARGCCNLFYFHPLRISRCVGVVFVTTLV